MSNNNVLIQKECQLRGRFYLKVEALDDDGNLYTKQELEFDNLITNRGLNWFGAVANNTNLVQNIQVGSGSTAPAFTDTNLAAFVKGQTVYATGGNSFPQSGTYDVNGNFIYARCSARFGQGEAAGNLTEVGAGTSNNTVSGNLFSRALILDTNGQPTTLTILPTEFLTVVYELRVYPGENVDQTATVVVGGVERTLTIRQSRNTTGGYWQLGGGNVAYFSYQSGSGSWGTVPYTGVNSTIGLPSADPSGTTYTAGASSSPAYVQDSFYRDIKTDFDLSMANGTIGALQCRCGLGTWQVGILPRIVKDNTMTMSITFRVSWARYTP